MYKAILFAPDGDWTTAYLGCRSIEEVESKLANQGSRYYFYPFHAVVVDHGGFTTRRQRLVSAAYPFEEMKGRTIQTFSRMLRNMPEEDLEAILRS